MNQKLLKILVCPVDKQNLKQKGNFLICPKNHKFSIDGGAPVLLSLSEMQGKEWQEWEEKQTHGLDDYEHPDKNYQEISDGIARLFGTFCGHEGTILDVGCGILPKSAYVPKEVYKKEFYIGLDPLRGSKKRFYHFVQGIAEKLPFKKDVFDEIVLATSLDHIINPKLVTKEALRVLKKNGEINIWIGVIEYIPAKNISIFDWLKDISYLAFKLKILQAAKRFIYPYSLTGADFRGKDQYHFHRFTRNTISELFDLPNLEVINSNFIEDSINRGSKHLFLKLKKKY